MLQNPNQDPFMRLADCDRLWAPTGQPIGAEHDAPILGDPVTLSPEATQGDTAYEVHVVTQQDGSVTIVYC